MEALDMVASTAEAAYATDGKRHIVAWNKAAERLMGYEGCHVLGKRCYQILRGTDPFGNRFCDETCALVNMARRNEAVHQFQLNLRKANARIVRADVSVIFLPARAPLEFTIIHTLRRAEGQSAAGKIPRITAGDRKLSESLTRRESEVLRLLADGRSSREIAASLAIGVETVRSHVKHILRKLKVHSRVEALGFARRNGLI